jgi:hypothetical protein
MIHVVGPSSLVVGQTRTTSAATLPSEYQGPTTNDEGPRTESQSRAAFRIPISGYLCAKVP